MQAGVTIRQHGFNGRHARVVLTNAGTVLATRDITLQSSPEQRETIEFHAGKAAVKSVTARIEPVPGETNAENNAQTRTVAVDDSRRRILYVEGEPRWDYKFLRRAVEDDPAIQVVSMLRTTQNKIYRQGIANPNELSEGFPSKPEDLFEYQGLILGSVEAAFFTTGQGQVIKDFVDRRGGGLLFLGGRSCLSDGGYNIQPFAELLPVNLPNKKTAFQRMFVPAELTEAGKRSLICRIEENADKSTAHWEVLPYLANYQDPGTPKPGATVLARVNVSWEPDTAPRHGELRTRPHGGVRYRRKLALAHATARGRQQRGNVLASTPALDRQCDAFPGRTLNKECDPGRRRASGTPRRGS